MTAHAALLAGSPEAADSYLEEALCSFQMAPRAHPSDHKLRYCEAFTLFRLKWYNEALRAAHRCLALYEGFPKPPHVQWLKSSLERGRTRLQDMGSWFEDQLIRWAAHEISSKGALRWQSYDLLTPLPALVSHPLDNNSASSCLQVAKP